MNKKQTSNLSARLPDAPADHAAHAATGSPESAPQSGHAGHDHDSKEGNSAEHDHEHGGPFGERSELVFALLSGACLLIGWLIGRGAPELSVWVSRGFYLAAYFFGGYFTLREAIETIRAGRFEIDFLMLVAAAGAAALGQWAEGALLLFLFSLGHALEGFAMGRARKAIEALADLAPKTALVRRDGAEVEVPVEEVEVGDVILIRPNSRIPSDGLVSSGESSVDQAPITGESVPVDKRPAADLAAARLDPVKAAAESRVFAGTINGAGALEVLVTKRASDSTLARVVRMVSEAEQQKSNTQRFTDRFERVFVPAVLALVFLLLFAFLVLDEPFSASFYRAMAVLVAASPCALAIATPSAVLSGVARAARSGVLIKGGAHLESLGSVEAIAFDKTGTLTEGRPTLTDVVAAEGATREELLRVAVAVEKQSDHPLAAAIVNGGLDILGTEAQLPEASAVEGIIGHGVKSTVDGQPVHIGKAALFGQVGGPALPAAVQAELDRLQSEGRTTMIVRQGERYLGVLGVMDTPRASARAVIAQLHQLGITRTLMLSGDNQQVADAVARSVGIDEAKGDLLPEDKVRFIKELADAKGKNGRSGTGVAMIGDGVNDAPAMANATVGVAMGAGGSDVALETADVALMGDDLGKLPFAVGLSRASRRIIQQNLVASLGMVAFLIPATLFGFAGIGIAVVLHEGSTLLVVLNALRLLAYRDPTESATPKP